MYIFAPLRLYHNDRAQLRAAAKVVLIFFRGTKISASWYLTISVPLRLKPMRL